jgi:hypothetical protein
VHGIGTSPIAANGRITRSTVEPIPTPSTRSGAVLFWQATSPCRETAELFLRLYPLRCWGRARRLYTCDNLWQILCDPAA